MTRLPDDFTFSQSSLQDAADCLRRFELRYLEQARYPALEFDNLLETERRAQQGIRFHRLAHQALLGLPPDALRATISDPDVAAWFETFLARATPALPARRYPEITLSAPLATGDAVHRLVAKFDLIAFAEDGAATIYDWKTARRLPKRAHLAARMQTVVYRYLLARSGGSLLGAPSLPPESITMRYWYAAHDGQSHDLPYSAETFAADEARLLALVDDLRSRDDFPLTADERRCRFCTYRGRCGRGAFAGSYDEYDGDFDDDFDAATITVDLDQIGELAF